MFQDFLTPFWKPLEPSFGFASPEEGTAEWYAEQGIKLGKQGYHIEAVEEFNKSINFGLELVEVYNNRGVAYAGLKRYREAIEDYNKAIELNLQFAEVYINRGLAYAELGSKTKAIADLKKFITMSSDPQLIDRVARLIIALSE